MASYLIFGGKIKERTVVIYQNQVFDFVRTTVMNHRNHPDNRGRGGVWFVFTITAQHR
jgi:hypothetical protein